MTASRGKRTLQRGVLIVPSLFTLGNLFCGIYAIRAAAEGRYLNLDAALERSAMFIFIAIVLDGLDGKIARFARATSPLGLQLDSLADIVSFGVAPGMLVYAWSLAELPRAGWPIACVFACCGAIRLARFNTQAGTVDSRYFVGLPIPAAAGTIAGMVLFWPYAIESTATSLFHALATVALSLLMVSTLRYRSFKQVELSKRRPATALLWVLLVFAVAAIHIQAALAAFGLLYAVSGPAMKLLSFRQARRQPADVVGVDRASVDHA